MEGHEAKENYGTPELQSTTGRPSRQQPRHETATAVRSTPKRKPATGPNRQGRTVTTNLETSKEALDSQRVVGPAQCVNEDAPPASLMLKKSDQKNVRTSPTPARERNTNSRNHVHK